MQKKRGKGAVRARKGFTLFILNEDMNDIIKIIKSLEDSNVLIDRVAERGKHEIIMIIKSTRRQISSFFVSNFSCFISAASNFFSNKKYV